MPDDHPQCVAPARTKALLEADVILLLGARLNWILHFGRPPRYASDVKFIHVSVLCRHMNLAHNNRNNDKKHETFILIFSVSLEIVLEDIREEYMHRAAVNMKTFLCNTLPKAQSYLYLLFFFTEPNMA